jgi:hypothetical protein
MSDGEVLATLAPSNLKVVEDMSFRRRELVLVFRDSTEQVMVTVTFKDGLLVKKVLEVKKLQPRPGEEKSAMHESDDP